MQTDHISLPQWMQSFHILPCPLPPSLQLGGGMSIFLLESLDLPPFDLMRSCNTKGAVDFRDER